MAVLVIVVWLVGTWVTRFSLEQMAFFAPVAMIVVGATVGLVLLWVKVVVDSLRRRRRAATALALRGDRACGSGPGRSRGGREARRPGRSRHRGVGGQSRYRDRHGLRLARRYGRARSARRRLRVRPATPPERPRERRPTPGLA